MDQYLENLQMGDIFIARVMRIVLTNVAVYAFFQVPGARFNCIKPFPNIIQGLSTWWMSVLRRVWLPD